MFYLVLCFDHFAPKLCQISSTWLSTQYSIPCSANLQSFADSCLVEFSVYLKREQKMRKSLLFSNMSRARMSVAKLPISEGTHVPVPVPVPLSLLPAPTAAMLPFCQKLVTFYAQLQFILRLAAHFVALFWLHWRLAYFPPRLVVGKPPLPPALTLCTPAVSFLPDQKVLLQVAAPFLPLAMLSEHLSLLFSYFDF